MLGEEICEGLVGQLLEVLHAVLGELGEGVPSGIVDLNALAGHGCPTGFATWQAERAIGDHDRATVRLRLDPQGDASGLEPGMTVWIAR